MASDVDEKESMRKIFVSSIDGEQVSLTGDSHAHLAYALRSRVGDEVILCCDKIDYLCRITAISKDETRLSVLSYSPNASEPSTQITLFFAILKSDKNDLVVQKCTELGVCEFVPFVSRNCERRADSLNTARLNKITEEAAKQCGRGFVPKVSEVADFSTVVRRLNDFDTIVFPYEKADKPDLKTFLSGNVSKRVAVIVGSEGGFTDEEADMLCKAGATSLTLGSRIMRAETASIAVCSAVMYEFGEWEKE
jgi:16S rRNA (uracil1498-N3)-methyltransferase